MDFAPYQSSPPEHGRTISPVDGAASPRTSYDARRSYSPGVAQRPPQVSPPPLLHPQPQRAWSGEAVRDTGGYQSPSAAVLGNNTSAGGGGWGVGSAGDYFGALGAREGMVSEFDTSLGLRLDYEACLAYLALPPLGAIILLILERKSDYVRYVYYDE